jgi:hypothetical protein
MKLEDWPEELPDASPPPGRTRVPGGVAAVGTSGGSDPGHLMTPEEWRQVQADAAALEAEGDDGAR